MEMDIGARVITVEGNKAGVVEKVVIDRNTNELVSIVVRLPFTAGRELAVPVEEIDRATWDKVYLKLTLAELENMPDFVESDYVPPPRHWGQSSVFPREHVLVPRPQHVDLGQPTVGENPHGAEAPVTSTRYPTSEAITITEGTEVFCQDGRVGTVDEIITDRHTNRVASFVVRKGTWLPKDVVVPSSLVSSYDKHRVILACRKDELNDLSSRR